MRTIIQDTATLHDVSCGVVYNPFDKRLHDASCSSLARMAASAERPKWHFTDRVEAEHHLVDHHARWGGKPWQPAACCRCPRHTPGWPRSPPHWLPLPEELRPLLSFEIGPRAVEEIAAKLVAWLTLDDAERNRAKLALAEEAARRYSWEKVAKGVIAAAQGRLNELDPATILQGCP